MTAEATDDVPLLPPHGDLHRRFGDGGGGFTFFSLAAVLSITSGSLLTRWEFVEHLIEWCGGSDAAPMVLLRQYPELAEAAPTFPDRWDERSVEDRWRWCRRWVDDVARHTGLTAFVHVRRPDPD